MNLPWSEIAGLVLLAIAVDVFVLPLIGRARVRKHLENRRIGRTEAEALELTATELTEHRPDAIFAAYRWVQQLVSVGNFPVYPDDELERDLRIEQRTIDDKFEAAYDAYGKEADKGIASSVRARTAADLMRAVLASGCEHYPRPHPSSSDSAA
jgi:hypothetical protein